ncbi:unnamed protein product [Trichobilharzia szidati]|nr:unnamed protein product [Trichobilharzia szidati]
MNVTNFFHNLPKIELHAHLSGSISRTFLKNALTAHQDIHNIYSHFGNCLRESDLEGCFNCFRTIHNLIQTPEILELATTSVVEEFHQDNVIYLELRTTLRPIPTHRSYLDAVIKGIQNAPSVIDGKMCVTLLLSIDRSKSIDDALITLNLAKEYLSNGLISGIDVSGNPQVGNLCDFIPMLNAAHLYGLKTTVHIAETPDQSEDWFKFLKNHLPDRLGHGTYLTNSDVNAIAAKEVVLNSRIPLGYELHLSCQS